MLAAVCAALALAGSVSAAADASKLGQLRDAVPNYDASLLPELTSANYSKFVENPKGYSIAVLFVTRDAKFQCHSCPIVESELLVVARSYALAVPPEQREWFFFTAVYPGADEAFRVNGFQSVPNLGKRGPGGKGKFPAGSVIEMPAMAGEDDARTLPSAAEIMAFLDIKDVPLRRDPKEQLSIALAFSVALALLAAVSFYNPSYLLLPLYKPFWMVVSLAIYGMSVSGMMYCIIRTPPMYTTGGKGEVELFGRRDGQMVYEGLVIGAMNLLAAGGIIMAYVTLKSKTASNARLVLFTLLGLALFALVYIKIVKLYAIKVGWYRVEATFPKWKWTDVQRSGVNVWKFGKRAVKLLANTFAKAE